jgi:hypothetical protein
VDDWDEFYSLSAIVARYRQPIPSSFYPKPFLFRSLSFSVDESGRRERWTILDELYSLAAIVARYRQPIPSSFYPKPFHYRSLPISANESGRRERWTILDEL